MESSQPTSLSLPQVRDPVAALLDKHPSFRVVLVGHSMGGATAALLALLLEEVLPFASVHAFAFAPAACASLPLARDAGRCVTSLVCTHDIVPCLSLAAIRRLNRDILLEAPPGASFARQTDGCEQRGDQEGRDLYPPGRILLLGWHDGGVPPRRLRDPQLCLSNFFTRKLVVDFKSGPSAPVCWDLTEASPEDFGTIRLSRWNWSDHMLSTIGEGLSALLLSSISRGSSLL